MDNFISYLLENIVGIVASIGIIIATLTGKPKSVEKLEKIKKRKICKLENKGIKLSNKLQKISDRLEEKNKEV